jgi:hypothetical protein
MWNFFKVFIRSQLAIKQYVAKTRQMFSMETPQSIMVPMTSGPKAEAKTERAVLRDLMAPRFPTP